MSQSRADDLLNPYSHKHLIKPRSRIQLSLSGVHHNLHSYI